MAGDGHHRWIRRAAHAKKTRQLTSWNTRGILFVGGTILGTTNRGNPFAHKMVVGGREVVEDQSSEVLNNIRGLGLDVLVVIGGDGSLKIGDGFHQSGVPVIGVPKTIDNDLMATHVTFGFQTAVDTATEALDKLHTTAESHQRVIILEVMADTQAGSPLSRALRAAPM